MSISAIGMAIGNYIRESILGIRSRLGGFILWMGRSFGMRFAPKFDTSSPSPAFDWDRAADRTPVFSEVEGGVRGLSGPMGKAELEYVSQYFNGYTSEGKLESLEEQHAQFVKDTERRCSKGDSYTIAGMRFTKDDLGIRKEGLRRPEIDQSSFFQHYVETYISRQVRGNKKWIQVVEKAISQGVDSVLGRMAYGLAPQLFHRFRMFGPANTSSKPLDIRIEFTYDTNGSVESMNVSQKMGLVLGRAEDNVGELQYDIKYTLKLNSLGQAICTVGDVEITPVHLALGAVADIYAVEARYSKPAGVAQHILSGLNKLGGGLPIHLETRRLDRDMRLQLKDGGTLSIESALECYAWAKKRKDSELFALAVRAYARSLERAIDTARKNNNFGALLEEVNKLARFSKRIAGFWIKKKDRQRPRPLKILEEAIIRLEIIKLKVEDEAVFKWKIEEVIAKEQTEEALSQLDRPMFVRDIGGRGASSQIRFEKGIAKLDSHSSYYKDGDAAFVRARQAGRGDVKRPFYTDFYRALEGLSPQSRHLVQLLPTQAFSLPLVGDFYEQLAPLGFVVPKDIEKGVEIAIRAEEGEPGRIHFETHRRYGFTNNQFLEASLEHELEIYVDATFVLKDGRWVAEKLDRTLKLHDPGT